jgi:hypothetical protein
MSLLINDDLIWVSIPKCASVSLEECLLASNLKTVVHPYAKRPGKHVHVRLHHLLSEFGTKETLCIRRDWFDRWLSGLKYLLTYDFKEVVKPKIRWEDFTNELIYEIFDESFADALYSGEQLDLEEPFFKLFNGDITGTDLDVIIKVMTSQNYWIENQKCTYEFDIKEMDKVEKFFKGKYGCDLKIKKINQSTEQKSKIIVDDKLKAFIWDLFEKPFIKRNSLL